MIEIKHENLGTVNKNVVYLKTETCKLKIFFSYETPVCFTADIKGYHVDMVRENSWSTTTGKFLNELEPDKKKRIPSGEFEEKLKDVLTAFE